MSHLSSLEGSSGKLLRRIHRACRPTLDEPNIALNLEICDLINQKQGNLPREAAVAVVKLINSRDPQVSQFALTLLDYLVKNCGYPIHLQISRKEFLNELVKRFPEHPPRAYSRTQRLILATISEWVQTLCKSSRYKEDLGYIRDMYRLLRSKGYEFPAVKREDAAVLTPSDNLKSIQEIQEEERLAQSAKLQELIRRGKPQDLQKANELMKIMSGFKEDEGYEQSRQKVHEELAKVGRKADLLSEMADSATNSGVFDTNDETIRELISSVKVAQPKIQKIVQEESDDADSVAKLLALNDKLNTVLQKVSTLSGGAIKVSTSSIAAPASAAPMNLIDFDDASPESTPAGSASPAPAAGSSNDAMADLLGDLGGLSFGSSTQTSAQSTALGSGAINLLADLSPSAPAAAPATAASTSPSTSPLTAFGSTSPAKPFFSSDNLSITYSLTSKQPSAVDLSFHFSNISLIRPISNLEFSLAVTKAFQLNLRAASGTALSAGVSDGVSQVATITHRDGSAFTKLKLKFRCSYNLAGTPTVDTGVATVVVN